MQIDPAFWAGCPVCVTGGSGFLGFHLVQQLRHLGAKVRIIGLEPPVKHPIWSMVDVDLWISDIRDPHEVRRATDGCRVVFHMAGCVTSAGKGSEPILDAHTAGTRNVLAQAPRSARLVHTSSVMAIGAGEQSDQILDEDSAFNLQRLDVPYVHAKHRTEELAMQAAQDRDVVIVNPGYLVGPEDHEHSIMGRLCLRIWKGRMPLAPRGGVNAVDVRDVARGHILAAQHARPGRRYILGGENLSYLDFFRLIGGAAGHHPRFLPVSPDWLLFTAANLAEWRSRYTRREPYPSLGMARVSQYHWHYTSERARRELGYHARPLRECLADAFAWHRGDRKMRLRGLQSWWLRAKAA